MTGTAKLNARVTTGVTSGTVAGMHFCGGTLRSLPSQLDAFTILKSRPSLHPRHSMLRALAMPQCANRASMVREEGPRRSGDRRGRRADPRVTGVDLSQKNVPATLTVLTRSSPRRGHFCGPGHSREARATGAAKQA